MLILTDLSYAGPPIPPELMSNLQVPIPIPGLLIPNAELSNVLLLTNLPAAITEDQARELINTFGEITSLNLITDPKGTSKSAAFEYADTATVEAALTGLNGLELGPMKLSLTRVPTTMAAALLVPASKTTAPSLIPSTVDPLSSMLPTVVLRMSNMVSDEDLEDEESYQDLKEDILEECQSHGKVKSIVIPRPEHKGDDCPGLKEIFVLFADVEVKLLLFLLYFVA